MPTLLQRAARRDSWAGSVRWREIHSPRHRRSTRECRSGRDSRSGRERRARSRVLSSRRFRALGWTCEAAPTSLGGPLARHKRDSRVRASCAAGAKPESQKRADRRRRDPRRPFPRQPGLPSLPVLPLPLHLPERRGRVRRTTCFRPSERDRDWGARRGRQDAGSALRALLLRWMAQGFTSVPSFCRTSRVCSEGSLQRNSALLAFQSRHLGWSQRTTP